MKRMAYAGGLCCRFYCYDRKVHYTEVMLWQYSRESDALGTMRTDGEPAPVRPAPSAAEVLAAHTYYHAAHGSEPFEAKG